MWDRTVTIGSAGKTFSVTGWKLGWAYGPHALIKNLMAVHQNTVYVCPTPLQVIQVQHLFINIKFLYLIQESLTKIAFFIFLY